jgi:(4-(4-[2-(gamma-L-glutamylamino)ethyl]phenoxymethyl)furan-2-yl)methanamine synthase
MAARRVIGWDIGGAHVKAALVHDGRLQAVRQWPCPLWQGLHLLDAVLDDALVAWLSPSADATRACHAVTMTGEMVDLFPSRRDGVVRLASHLRNRLGPDMRLFGGDGQWLSSEVAADNWQALASANWAATARLASERIHDGGAMLVDIGSTTTDFVPLPVGERRSTGSNDAQRLRSGELLYQGVIRTPLCALSRRIEFRGERYNVMNEWFATTADVYRLTGELDPLHDQHPAADGGAKDFAGACRRIARMIGHDSGDAGQEVWIGFAARWRSLQLDLIQAELQRVEGPTPAATLVGAGCGSFLVQELAQRLRRRHVPFAELVCAPPSLRGWAGVCAPAVAVAFLGAGSAHEWH